MEGDQALPAAVAAPSRRGEGRLWRWELAVGLGAAAAIYLVPRGGTAWVILSIGVSTITLASLVVGVRLHRPEHRAGWRVLQTGFLLNAIANAFWYPAQASTWWTIPYPSLADLLYLGGYALIGIGMSLQIRSRTAGRDRTGLLDTLIVAAAASVLSWEFLIERNMADSTLGALAKPVSVAYPLVDLVLLGVFVRLLFLPGRRSPAAKLVGAYLGAQLLADTVYSLGLLDGSFGISSPSFGLWLACYAFLGAAALHPSMRVLTEPTEPPTQAGARVRLAVIGGSALVAPVTLVLSPHDDVPVIAALSAGVFALVLVRMSGLMVSVEEHRRTQERLREAEANLRSTIEEVPAVVYAADFGERGRWRYVSPQVESMLGYPAASWTEDPDRWFDAVEPEDRAQALADEARSRSTGRPLRSEYRMRRADGRRIWVRDEAVMIRDEAGEPAFMQGVLTDITDRKEAERALERLNQELERRVAERTRELEAANRDLLEAKEAADRANQAKSEFLSRMSHELRTPLNAILGFGRLLEAGDISERDRESVAQILRGGRHLLDLINEVLDIAKIEARGLSLSIEPVPLRPVVTEALDLIAPLAAGRDVRLRCDEHDGDPAVLADRQRLTQVLLNLLSNAVKNNRPGGSVLVSCEVGEDETRLIRVTDDGPGIEADRMHKLFSVFDRLGAERTGVEGTGLGLALTKALVEAMGGAISARSEVGRGSTFTVRLPRADAA